MKPEEARRIIMSDADYSGIGEKAKLTADALCVAVDALEKQIPMRVKKVTQSYGTPYRCPVCEADQTPVEFFKSDGSEPEEKVTWCWHCGYAIDWSEET